MKHQHMSRALLGALLVSSGVISTSALAAPPPPATPGYCSGNMATEGIAAGNMTFNSVSANDCYGVVSGNINNGDASTLNAMNWGAGWTYFDSTDPNDAPGGAFMGLTFSVTATPGTSGSWTLTGTDTNFGAPLNFPTSLDFAVGLKGGNEYALWGFDNAAVTGTDSGTFSIVFTNNGGNTPNLSHLIVFGRVASGGSIAAIPEPETYAMLLAGLGLVGFAARRKLPF